MAVSIWEGNKAQELIDAIAQGKKVNKWQGYGESGKVLVVGDDGYVTTGNVALSETAIEAILTCFTHVIWDDQYGQQYYNMLETALRENTSYVSNPYIVFDGTFYKGISSTSQSGESQIEARNDRLVFGAKSGIKPYVSSVDGSDLDIYPIKVPDDAKAMIISCSNPSLYLQFYGKTYDETEEKYISPGSIPPSGYKNCGYACNINIENGNEYLFLVFRIDSGKNVDFDETTIPESVNIAFLKVPLYEEELNG